MEESNSGVEESGGGSQRREGMRWGRGMEVAELMCLGLHGWTHLFRVIHRNLATLLSPLGGAKDWGELIPFNAKLSHLFRYMRANLKLKIKKEKISNYPMHLNRTLVATVSTE